MSENIDFEGIFTKAVNLVVKQQGGKRGVVKSVDEDKLICDIDPSDNSAPIVGARLTALAKGVYAIPTIDSLVSIITLHLESDHENDWGIVQYSEIDKYIITADKTVNITANKEGIAIEAKEKDINLKAEKNNINIEAKESLNLKADKVNIKGESEIIMTSDIKLGSENANEKAILAEPLIAEIKKIIETFNNHTHSHSMAPAGTGTTVTPLPTITANFDSAKSQKVVLE